MALKARRFKPRAPRYILRPHDAKLIRFASSRKRFRKFDTTIYDISSSGLSFIIRGSAAPVVGDVIGMEFVVPGAFQIACMGRVCRVEEEYDRSGEAVAARVKVGVAFANLPMKYKELLESNVADVIYEAQQHNLDLQYLNAKPTDYRGVLVNFFKLMVVVALVSALSYVIYNANNSPEKPKSLPWADNFAREAVKSK